MSRVYRPVPVILAREWSAYFNSPIAYVFLVIFLVLAGFFTFGVTRLYESGQADLRPFFFWHPWLYLILVPAVTMRLWAEEQRSGTVELLLTLSVKPSQAILAKFFAAWLFLGLALALTFPMVLTAYYLGEPDGGVIFSGYLGSFLLAGAYVSVGLFASAITRNQVISFVVGVFVGLFLLLAGFPPVTELMSRWAPVWLVDGVASFSFMHHYDMLQRGLISLGDLTYFAGVMVVMLTATHAALTQRMGRT
ncbi:MAG TPA: ABC transporter permease [Kiritimatiellia bacterium]|nr:ABC transporter permease [Kiritimatiellia bacterium]HMO99385.1 ABC transporter permease [Kiritimatiellia bacterium]HMP96507.1 ABC transporter permease [Kiritimatiellia bacterium]